MKLYSVSDGPPSLACRQALKALNIQYELVDVDFGKGEHMTDEYAQLNPQKEIPVLVDNDLVMGESNAILQYLGDKYDTEGKLYPKDPQARAIINHRLCFNLAMYYRSISEYVMAPIFFDYKRTPLGLKKMTMALDVFNTYLQRDNTEYAAGNILLRSILIKQNYYHVRQNHSFSMKKIVSTVQTLMNDIIMFQISMFVSFVEQNFRRLSNQADRLRNQKHWTKIFFNYTLTIADFPLITATMCLEAINFKLSAWPNIEKWYNNFKHKHSELWEIAAKGMQEISYFEENPPDLSNMDHPIHPIRKNNK